MAEQARVTSIDALEAFRGQLVLYISETTCALDEALYEVKRTRAWLETEQRTKWQTQLRRRKHVLDQAEQELHRARLSSLQDNLMVQQRAVRRAREATSEAETKLRKIKGWIRNYDRAVAPYAKKLESLHQIVDEDLPKAVAYLVQLQKTLDTYTDSRPSRNSTLPAAPSDLTEEPPTDT